MLSGTPTGQSQRHPDLESNPYLLVHSQACRNRYTTDTINVGRRHRSATAQVEVVSQ